MPTSSVPKVSVIVPNYNHARFLRRRIDSILAQSLQHFELILLDDSSTDDSRSILAEYASDARVKILLNEVNSGSPFKQWNKGVELSRSEYVWIAESDDYAAEKFLERLSTTLDANPRAAFAYCRSWRVSVNDQTDGLADPCVEPLQQNCWAESHSVEGIECYREFIRTNIVLNASAVVFRRTAYLNVGGADESLTLCGDWKLWTAMAATGEFVYLAEPLNYYRFHDATVRSAVSERGSTRSEILRVRWWILDQASRSCLHSKDAAMKRELTQSLMDQAFQCYAEFPEITRLALQRVKELGGTTYTPSFGTWKGEMLKRILGWKATRRAHLSYHRLLDMTRARRGTKRSRFL